MLTLAEGGLVVQPAGVCGEGVEVRSTVRLVSELLLPRPGSSSSTEPSLLGFSGGSRGISTNTLWAFCAISRDPCLLVSY